MADQTPPAPQEKLARRITSTVLWGTCVFGALGMSIAIIALFKGSYAYAKEILQLLLTAILPLFGTWIGTILAFYYSKENLAAANRTVDQLVKSITSDKKLENIKAKEIMIALKDLKYFPYPDGTDDKAVTLASLLKFIQENKISRAILLNASNVAKYVLHKSTIEGYIAQQYLAAAAGTTPSLTLADLKNSSDDKIKAIINDGIKFIKEDANLSDAKVLIKNFAPACNDIFITKNGSKDEPVLGWITDKTIAEGSIVS